MRRNKSGFSTTFGLWLIIALAIAYLPFTMLLRTCDAFIQGSGRYCSIDQAKIWLLHEGGWWKALIAAAFVGSVVYFACDRKASGNEKPDRDSDQSA